MKQLLKSEKGFTLLELLIVIVIIAILAAIVIAALDPATRFKDARDARRTADATELLQAIKIDQIDNGGDYLFEIEDLVEDNLYMIGTATATCDDEGVSGSCDVTASSDASCVDLSDLVTEGYIGEIPISPAGQVTWDATKTGYVLTKNANGTITIDACESENTSSIQLVR